MPLHRDERPHTPHPFVGTWHITDLVMGDADYVDMERQADRSRFSAHRVRSAPTSDAMGTRRR